MQIMKQLSSNPQPDSIARGWQMMCMVVATFPPARTSKLQPDFNVRVFERFDASASALLRELDESHRFVQKSAESTSM